MIARPPADGDRRVGHAGAYAMFRGAHRAPHSRPAACFGGDPHPCRPPNSACLPCSRTPMTKRSVSAAARALRGPRASRRYLVTATHGQSGRYHEHTPASPATPGSSAWRRSARPSCAPRPPVLGIREVDLLGYIDGRLDDADPVEVIDRIARQVRRIRPHVVVTFAMDGGYGHPDHIAICQFATAATVVAADPASCRTGAPHAVPSSITWRGARPNGRLPGGVQDAHLEGRRRRARGEPMARVGAVDPVDTRAWWPRSGRPCNATTRRWRTTQSSRIFLPGDHEGLWGRAHALSRVQHGQRRARPRNRRVRGTAPRGA